MWKDQVVKYSNNHEESVVRTFLNKFKDFKNSLHLSHFEDAVEYYSIALKGNKVANDMLCYNSFEDIESVVDFLTIITQKQTNKELVNDSANGTLIYSDDNVEVKLAESVEGAIKLGEGYNWCICKSDKTENLFYSYRIFGEKTFYFVKNKHFTNEYDHFVIQVTKNNSFLVTSSLNNGDVAMTWGEITKISPTLVGKKSFFKSKGLTEKEHKFKRLMSLDLGEKNLRNIDIETKVVLIQSRKLNPVLFFSLTPKLKELYFSHANPVTREIFYYAKRKPKLWKIFLEKSEEVHNKITNFVNNYNPEENNGLELDYYTTYWEIIFNNDYHYLLKIDDFKVIGILNILKNCPMYILDEIDKLGLFE